MSVIPLFHDGDLAGALERQLTMAKESVNAVPEPEFRATDPAAITARFARKYTANPVSITEGAISVQASDAQIDRRRVRDRDFGFPGDPVTVPGTRVTYNVPYTGDQVLFRLMPSASTSVLPRAELTDSEVRFHYDVPSSEVARTKSEFDRDLSLTKQWLDWVNKQVTRFNSDLIVAIEGAVGERVSRLEVASRGLATLGLPIRHIETVKADAHLGAKTPAIPRSGKSGPGPHLDVALSFAGEDRAYVQKVAKILADAGAKIFYDEFESVSLWGKDLVEHLQDIYQYQARYCVLFISQHYVSKPWPTHERRSAQARALVASEEYLLPARFDDTPVPGLPPTIGYIDLRSLTPEEFASRVLEKLGIRRAEA